MIETLHILCYNIFYNLNCCEEYCDGQKQIKPFLGL